MSKVIKLPKKCEDCDECTYICEGDFACMITVPPVLVIEEWVPTDEYRRCCK